MLARHRFHRLCWEARLHTRAGRLPVVLWTRPTKVGERLFVWCRAGICADDFTQNAGELAAACYAREARVTRNTAWSQIVTIDIIRRDTLAARHKVGTPLSRLYDVYAAFMDGESFEVSIPDPKVYDITSTGGDGAPLPWPQPPVPRDPGSPEQAA